jgi:hypothetical protein
MAGKYLAQVGDGEASVTSEVQVYEFRVAYLYNKNFIVLDTPGLSDSKGLDNMRDDDIKSKIENAILKNAKKTGVMVDALLIFETCENKMSQINITLRPLRGMFGNSFYNSSICMLTGCSDRKY